VIVKIIGIVINRNAFFQQCRLVCCKRHHVCAGQWPPITIGLCIIVDFNRFSTVRGSRLHHSKVTLALIFSGEFEWVEGPGPSPHWHII